MGVLGLAFKGLQEASNYVIDTMQIEKAGGTIKACAIAAAAAGVGAGWLPGAGALVASAAWVAAIWGMYIKVNKDLDISISENILKSLASAFLTNIIASAGALIISIVLGAILAFLPGIGTVGAVAIDGFIGYITVFASGVLYIKLLTRLFKAKGKADFSGVDVKDIAKEVVAASNMKEILKEAKSEYKKDKKNGNLKK